MADIQIKPYLTTKAAGFRQLLYAKLVDLCSTSSNDVLKFFAVPPAVPVWNYASYMAWTAPDADILRLLASDTAMLTAFSDWLELPDADTAPVMEAINAASNAVDPVNAPGDVLGDEAKNGTGSSGKRGAPKSSTT